MNRYQFGVLDCPWEYDNKQQNDPARGGITYPYLSMQELYELPMGTLFEKDSGIAMWITLPKLLDQYYEKYDPLSIMRHWGFRPVVVLFVWVKTNRLGRVIHDDTDIASYEDFYSGLGKYTNSNVEILVYGRRGKGLKRQEKNVKQLLFAPLRGHSEKPQEQYNRYERLFGKLNAIEVFARKVNPPPEHYAATGLDWDGVDIRDFLKDYAT